MNVRELLGKRMLFFDGGMGSMLQKNGMGAGEIPELLNLTNAALIEKIHTEYLEAGANIITTNTFGANPLKSEEIGESLDMIIAAAIGIARKAVNSFQSEGNPRFVAFDIGPCGKLLEPLGDLSFDDCYDAFAKIAKTTQIIAVSHLAQIACMSDGEFLIEKKEENGKTRTFIRALSAEEQKEEIVRLLGGEQGEQAAYLHAEELLQRAREFKAAL